MRSAPKGTEHVLFVDDEASIVSAASLALRALGYKVTALLDAEQALDLFKTAPQSFDLVFSDVTMPGMTGVELARRMRTVRSDVPIILGTGFSELITEEQARVAGLKLLMKPYASEKLATAIREVLDQAKGAAA